MADDAFVKHMLGKALRTAPGEGLASEVQHILDRLSGVGLYVVALAGRSRPCAICGDPEPSHVHLEGKRIDDYFTVGRGETDIEAACRWQGRALAAERSQDSEGTG